MRLAASGSSLSLFSTEKLKVRLHTFQDRVEVVGVDLDELAVLQSGQRLLRLAGEIAEHSHHERKLLQLDGAADFHVIGDLYARGAYPI